MNDEGKSQRWKVLSASSRPFPVAHPSSLIPHPSSRATHRSAFTLIELLIVVAIIAILALIAVPNFLAAQVRAKAARARADLRSIATAIEAYAVDVGDYPRNWMYGYGTIPPDLTTPVAYLSSLNMEDPFAVRLHDRYAQWNDWQTYVRHYTYDRILPLSEANKFADDSPWRPGVESIDGPWPPYNEGALARYGQWRLFSIGPDRRWIRDGDVRTMDILYDPTNGMVSWGNIIRTQRHPDGRIEAMPESTVELNG
jgi:prepilin-type N-terminal cleavage/methylation domain-containing protein